ncbi:MAG: DUF4180 domain-containing protein [bacterium]
MTIILHERNHLTIAEIQAVGVILSNVQEALDIMMTADDHGARKIIFHEENVTSDFFNLSTGLAGEILQKFTNYMVQIAMVGNFSKYSSVSLQAFILESNRRNQIFFLPTLDAAIERLWQI